MRNLVPLRGSVLCKKVDGGESTTTRNGLKIYKKTVDIYKIIELPVVPSAKYDFKLGDEVISNSTGDEIEINGGETVYLFKLENIMCVVNEQKEDV